MPVHIDATGSFVAEESSDVAPLTSGRVAATPVDVGAFVKRGDIIVRLDDSDARLRLRQATASAQQTEAGVRQAQFKIGLNPEASFDPTTVPEVQGSRANYESALAEVRLAEADAQRYANLVRTGDVSQSNYEKARTQAETAKSKAHAGHRQYEAAMNTARQNYGGIESAQASLEATRAQLAIAQKALDDTVIRAPISGYISARSVSVGEYVSTSSKIVTILRADPIKLQLQVPEADAGRLSVGRPVSARVAAHGTRDFKGRITALNLAVDATSRAMTIEAKFNNPGLNLRPGIISLPLRNRTAEANLGASIAEGRRIQNQREQLEQLIEADVRNSMQSVGSAKARLDAATTARRSAEAQYESEQRKLGGRHFHRVFGAPAPNGYDYSSQSGTARPSRSEQGHSRVRAIHVQDAPGS